MADQTRKPKAVSTPEAREKQLTSLAYHLAEQQLLDGTASPSVITHFLKLGTAREKLERDILISNRTLLDAKADGISSARDSENLSKAAMDAIKGYRGNED